MGKTVGMEPDKLSAEQAKKLADELSALSKLQSEALEAAIYVSMSQEEAKEYDERGARIGELTCPRSSRTRSYDTFRLRVCG